MKKNQKIPIPQGISKRFRTFLSRIMTNNSFERPNIMQVIFSDYYQELK